MRRLVLFVTVLSLAVLLTDVNADEERQFQQFWMQYNTDFHDSDRFAEALEMLDTAEDAGVTHMILNERGMHRWDMVQESYRADVARFREAADQRDIVIVPNIFPIGYGIRYLVHDVNMAAGIPAENVPFIVRGDTALPDPAAVPQLVNPSLDEAEGHRLVGWRQDGPGTITFVDTTEKHSGTASLQIRAPQEGQRAVAGRITQTVEVEPFKYYRLSFWVKTEQARPAGASFAVVWTHDRRRRNTYFNVSIAGTQDWTRHDVVFNTLDADSADIVIGPGNFRTGTMWIDSISIEPAGILNVVRRELAPLTVTSADGEVVYDEGRDFEHVHDPQFIYSNLASIDHEGAPIRITEGSRIRDGERILVSYYHTMRIYNDQVVLTLSDPILFEYMERQMEHIAELWESTIYFMSADEIRIAGWEHQPDGEDLSVAQMLARYMERSYDIVGRHSPDSRIAVWSDMFTPFHNGRPLEERGPYFLCTGSFYNSWAGLPRDVLIMNWYSPNRLTPVWFEVRGHEQVLCGYYDTDDLKANIAHWMNVTRGVDNIVGMMYTQWFTGHERMKEFFELVGDYPNWLKGPEASRAVTSEQ